MRRVVFNQKGGVGKSSITCNLAAIAANSGKRTLLLDLDPQGNSTQYLLGETPFANLSIMASAPQLEEIEQKLESRHKIYKLRDLLNKLEPHFDEVFIDTAPAMNFYTTSALVSADRVLIPFDCDAFSRHALYNILHVIGEIRDDHNEDLLIEGIIANQFQPRANLPTQIINELIAEKHPVLPIYLNQSVKMRESHQAGKPLIHFAPSHPLTLQFLALHDHLNNKKRTKKTTAR